jgi:hypothetical protein
MELKKKVSDGGAFSVRLSPGELKILDQLRRKEEAPPSRGGMIRKLIEQAAIVETKK